jgi:hypothetical protein
VHGALTVLPASPAARIVNFTGLAMLAWGGLGLRITVNFVPRQGRTPRFWIVVGVVSGALSFGGLIVADASYVLAHMWFWTGIVTVAVALLAWWGWRQRAVWKPDRGHAAPAVSAVAIPAPSPADEGDPIPDGDP